VDAYFKRIEAKYGLSKDEFLAILVHQDGRCRCCPTEFVLFSEDRALRPVVDHCHTNGHVRGLLCTGCNTAAGYIEKDKERTVRVLQYLADTACAGGWRVRTEHVDVRHGKGRWAASRRAQKAARKFQEKVVDHLADLK
jgi:hypothetical protein